MRSVEAVISEIDLLSTHISRFRETFSTPTAITTETIAPLRREVNPIEVSAFNYALKWYMDGMKSVFLQDADSLVIGSDNLIKILIYLHEKFPWIERVTTYSRSSTIQKVGEEGFISLKDAGLTRIHVGLESGSNEVLKLVKKGATQDIHIRAGVMVKQAGFELSEYVMPGLGGKRYTNVHAVETAKALNQINPDFIRLRPLAITSRAPLYLEFERGKFKKLNDIEMTQELRLLIDGLYGIESMVLSDHILNLFADLEGKLPHEKEKMLFILDSFLKIDSEHQLIFRLGRRLGLFSSLDDLRNRRKINRVHQIVLDQGISEMNIDSIIDELMQRFI